MKNRRPDTVSFMYLYNAVINDINHMLWSSVVFVTFSNDGIYKIKVGRYI